MKACALFIQEEHGTVEERVKVQDWHAARQVRWEGWDAYDLLLVNAASFRAVPREETILSRSPRRCSTAVTPMCLMRKQELECDMVSQWQKGALPDAEVFIFGKEVWMSQNMNGMDGRTFDSQIGRAHV